MMHDQGDRVEIGVWQKSTGKYTALGWAWLSVNRAAVTGCSVPDADILLTQQEFCAALGIELAPPAATTETTAATTTTTARPATTTAATTTTVVVPVDATPPKIEGDIKKQDQGDRVEWGVWTPAAGYKTLGWVFINEITGQITDCRVPEGVTDLLMNQAQFCTFVGGPVPVVTTTVVVPAGTATTTTAAHPTTGAATTTTTTLVPVDATPPTLEGEVKIQEFPDMEEWGVWTSEDGYVTLGWVWRDLLGNITSCSVPESGDLLMNQAQFCTFVGGPVPVMTVAVPVTTTAATTTGGAAATTTTTTVIPTAPVAAPKLDGQIFKSDLGDYTEWGLYDEAKSKYTTLGWVWTDAAGRVTDCTTPDVNPLITAAELCALAEQE
jgi:hypothetical protein